MNDEELNNLLSGDLTTWLGALPLYQRRRIESLMNSGMSIEDAAKAWLGASVENTFPFGADKGKGIFYDKVLAEIEKFLCGSDDYSEARASLRENNNVIHTYCVGVISAAIAPVLGTSAVFLAPVVALLLASIGQVSLRAWCETRGELRKEV